jgi:hypothetical protein
MLKPAKNQAQITKLYRNAGMKPPVGKGEHTMAFHRLVTKLGKQKGIKNPYAVAMKQLGPEKAVHKEHRHLKRKK